MGESENTVKAYILAVVEIGKDHEVAERIKALDSTADIFVDLVFGEFDLVAVVKTDSIRKLDRLVTQVRKLNGVLKTVTLVAS